MANKKMKKTVAKKSASPKKIVKKPVVKAKAVAPKMAAKPAAKVTAKPAGKGSSKASLQHENLSDIFTPLDDRVLIEVERAAKKTAGGLFIPDSSTQKPSRGTVLAVGRGRCDKKGYVRPMDVKRGDEVLFAAFSGTPVELSGRDIIILREADLLGVIE